MLRKILIIIIITVIMFYTTNLYAIPSMTTDDQAGTPTTWVYKLTINGTVYTVPSVSGINTSLIRLLTDASGKVNLGVVNTSSVTLTDEFGQTSAPSSTFTFTPKLPLTPVTPQMVLLNGKRQLVSTATTKDTDNVNGILQYVVVIGSKTKTVDAIAVTSTTQRCECDLTDMVVVGANVGSITAKNPWGLSTSYPLALNVSVPTTPSGLRFSVE